MRLSDDGMTQQKHTFCRICEPACPIFADIDDSGKVIRLRPNHEHISGGVACHKGLAFLEVHNDPDRLNYPQKRTNPRSEARGKFVDTNWSTAIDEIGEQLRALRKTHGNDCIAVYSGNPLAFNATGLLMSLQFQDQIGTRMRFGANTQDAANKIAAAGEIYGSSLSLMLPDLHNTDYLLCLGTNPKVTRFSAFSMPNDSSEFAKRIKQRGGKVRFVNPRKIETSTDETGPTLLIKPASDVYFLAAVLNEIEFLGGFADAALSKHGKNVPQLKEFVRRYPAEKVSKVTGITAEAIKEVAAEIVAAESVAVFMATGLAQSRQGTLCYWLGEMIHFATGNLGRKGGAIKPTGLLQNFPPIGGIQRLKTSLGEIELPDPIGGFGLVPATILPDLIENKDIRALIVLAGNPVLSVGGEERMRKACEKLDLMVSIDIYRSATGELCDYALPATDWIERMDIPLLADGLQLRPFVQYSDALEEPAHERRNMWWILTSLIKAMGMPLPLHNNPSQDDDLDLVNRILAAKELSIEKLKAAPQQSVVLPLEKPESLFEHCLQHADKKIDCCPPAFAKAGLFERCDAIFRELTDEPDDVLKIISMRTPYDHNSWLSNTATFRRGKHSLNPLNMCEADAASRGLHNGDAVRVFTKYGEIKTQLFINNELRPGAVALSHGRGNQKTFALTCAHEKPGANYNALVPTDSFEPLSYMSWLNGVPVNVEKIEF